MKKEAKTDFKGAKRISTTINKNLWNKARKRSLNWAECMRIGITTKLSQLGDNAYNNPEQTKRKLDELKKIIGTLNSKIITYEKEQEEFKEIEIKSTEV